MSIKEKLMSVIKKNDFLFTLLYSLKKCPNKEFQKYIHAMTGDGSTILLVEGDSNLENDIFYIIDCGLTQIDGRGFFALIRQNMRLVYFAEVFHLKPCIAWGEKSVYYDHHMDNVTYNAFEYFFEPLSLKYSDVLEKHRFIRSRSADIKRIPEGGLKKQAYRMNDNEIEMLASIYRKYFRLNSRTQEYINDAIGNIIQDGEKFIGVHVRGTDFKNQFDGHPEFSGFEQFIEAAKDMIKKYKYDKIFLATEDEEALELFRNEFGNQVVFYKDCERAKGKSSIICNENVRPYNLGLQVLRDVYTLVCSDVLICGLSQVSFAVQYIKNSRNESFSHINQIEMNINNNRNDVRSYSKSISWIIQKKH